MDYTKAELERLEKQLQKEILKYRDSIAAGPEGGLIFVHKGGRSCYSHAVPAAKSASGQRQYKRRVIKSDQRQLIAALAKKEYSRVAHRILQHNIQVLQRAKDRLWPFNYEDIRKGMRTAYCELPDSLFKQALHDEMVRTRAEQWAAESYEESDYLLENRKDSTSRGLFVRSRAEVLIVEKLYEYDIPFRYEQVIHIGQYKLEPDFTFLDKNGEEFYWEYCGMMNDPCYVRNQLWRRGIYESIGINEWTNMIYTYGTNNSIDMREIEAVIRTKILPRIRMEAA